MNAIRYWVHGAPRRAQAFLAVGELPSIRSVATACVTLILTAALVADAGQRPRGPVGCAGAVYRLDATGRVDGDLSVTHLVVGPSQVAIPGVCEPIAPTRFTTKRNGTVRVKARWRDCAGTRGRVVLKASIVDGCESARGKLKGRGFKLRFADARPLRCGDGLVDDVAGESCDPPDGVRCSAICQIVPTTSTIVVTTTSTTTAPPDSTTSTTIPGDCGVDSDDNGVADCVEWGPNPSYPLDTDGDLRPDHLDTDDDGDGIVDVLDPNRLLPEPAPDPLDPDGVRLTHLEVAFESAWRPTAAVREGDRVMLVGTGFGPTAETVVLFGGPEGPVGAFADHVTDTTVEVTVPAGVFGPVAVFSDGLRSNDIDLLVGPSGAPLLLGTDPAVPSVAGVVTLFGLGLDTVNLVQFPGVAVAPTQITSTAVEVLVPVAATSGLVGVEGPTGLSNQLTVTVGREQTVAIDTPAPMEPSTLLVLSSALYESAPDTDGLASALVDTSAPTMVTAFDRDPASGERVPVLLGLALPGDDPIALDATSTAVAMVLRLGAVMSQEIAAVDAARAALETLPEVQALADVIEAGLMADRAFVSRSDAALRGPLLEALQAGGTILLGTNARASSRAFARLGAQAAGPSPGEPGIFPAGEQWDVSIEPVPDTGNVKLVNATRLYLSVAVGPFGTDAPWWKGHVNGYFDPDIVGTQEGVRWGTWNYDQRLDLPNYRDAAVEVITPGLLGPQPTSDAGRATQFTLQLRTYVDQLVMPVVSELVGDLLPADRSTTDLVLNLVVRHLSDGVSDARQLFAAGDGDAAATVVYDALRREISNPGALIYDLATAIARRLPGAVAERIAERLALRAIPVVGQIRMILDVIDKVAEGIDAVIVIHDFADTPGLIEWDVAFGLALSEVDSEPIERGCLPQLLFIDGYGLVPNGDASGPTVTLFDRGGGTFEAYQVPAEAVAVSVDGREMRVDLPEEFTRTVRGPVTVEVAAGDEAETWPTDIPVIGEFEMTDVAPRLVRVGDELVLTGSGFDPETAWVILEEAAPEDPDDPREVASPAADVTPTEIRHVLPTLPGDVGNWEVYVEQGPSFCRVPSRRLPLTDRGAIRGTYLQPLGAGSLAMDVSSEGVVVGVGNNERGHGDGVLWAPNGTMIPLPERTNWDGRGWPYRISRNGAFVVGTFQEGSWRPSDPLGDPADPVRWFLAENDLRVGRAPSGTVRREGAAVAVSEDGKIAVGWDDLYDVGLRAVRWVNDGTNRTEVIHAPEWLASVATDVSADGQVVGGRAKLAFDFWTPFLWTADGGFVVPDPPLRLSVPNHQQLYDPFRREPRVISNGNLLGNAVGSELPRFLLTPDGRVEVPHEGSPLAGVLSRDETLSVRGVGGVMEIWREGHGWSNLESFIRSRGTLPDWLDELWVQHLAQASDGSITFLLRCRPPGEPNQWCRLLVF